MSKKKGRSSRRTGRFSLLQWGLIIIFASVVANPLTGLAMTKFAPPAGTAAARGQEFGKGLATLMGISTGVVFIVIHFARRDRR